MKLLRQLDIGEYDNSADPSDAIQPESNLPGIIGQVNGTPESQITGGPGYFNGYTPEGLTPQQRAQYQQKQQLQNSAPTGALSNDTYYPGINHPTNVGNYTGSEIGSTTLFSPGVNVVPLGMKDARDAAVHKQALQKLKEDEDFKSKYNVPYTKNTALNDELHQKYFEGQKQFYDNTVKKTGLTGAAAHRYLEKDPHYQEWNASMQSAAKHEDYLVDKVARIHTDVKTGKFRSYPELDEAINGVMNEHAKLGQSDINPKGEYKFHQKLGQLEAESDFATVANDAVQHMVKQQDAAAGIDVNSPEYLKTFHSTDKYLTPDAIHNMAEQIHPLVAHNMGNIENTEKRLQAMYGAHEKTKGVTISEKNGSGKKDSDYSSLNPNEKTFNYTGTRVTNPTGGTTTKDKTLTGKEEKISYTNKSPLVNSYTFQENEQKVPITVPITSEMGSLKGGDTFNTSSGSVNVNSNVFGVGYRNQNTGEWLDKDEVDKMDKNGTLYTTPGINAKAIALGSVLKTTEEGDHVPTGDAVHIPLNLLKDKYKAKGLTEKMQEVEDKAKEINEKIKQTQYQQKVKKAEEAVTPNTMYSIKGKDYSLSELKKLGYTEEQVLSYRKK